MQKRLGYIDAVKAIGIILVICGHCYWIDAIPYLRNCIYSFHMPLFFIITGFFVKPLSLGNGCKKYIRAYLLPYYKTTIIALGICLLISLLYPTDTSIMSEWFKRAIFASGGGLTGIWSDWPIIGPIWFLYGIFWACLGCSYIEYKTEDVCLKAVSYLLIALVPLFAGWHITLPLSFLSGLYAMLFVAIGFYLKKWRITTFFEQTHRFTHILILLLWIVCIRYGQFNVGMLLVGLGPFSIIVSIGITIDLILICKKFSFTGGWIGCHTLEILCAHSIIHYIYYIYGNPFSNFAFLPQLNFFVECAFEIITAIVFAKLLSFKPILKKA